jgi:hypothetical protein
MSIASLGDLPIYYPAILVSGDLQLALDEAGTWPGLLTSDWFPAVGGMRLNTDGGPIADVILPADRGLAPALLRLLLLAGHIRYLRNPESCIASRVRLFDLCSAAFLLSIADNYRVTLS